jgi:signal transduction histidine kinase
LGGLTYFTVLKIPPAFLGVLANAGIIFHMIVYSYTITKQRLMDISVVISRTVAWAITVIFLGVIYGALVWVYRTFVTSQIDWFFFAGTVIFGILVGETFQRIRLFVQTTSDKLFLRGKYDYYQELEALSSEITKRLSMDNILTILKKAFLDIIEVSHPRIYLTEDFAKPEVKDLLAYQEVTPKGDDLIIPCRLENRLIALIVLGKKLSEDPYTPEDLKLLKALANQTAVAIDHTHTYEEIKNDYEATQKLLARSERIASMASLIQEYNQQNKTPLAIMKSKIALLPDDTKELKDLAGLKKYLQEEIDRANGIVESTLRLSRPKEYHEVALNLNEIIDEALKLFPPSGVHLTKDFAAPLTVKGDQEDLQLALVNLIKNAVEAMTQGGELKISTYSTVEGGQSLACVAIADTGQGIPEENLEKIFEPFFSTRTTKGRGLGLSIVFRIIREHGANISVKSILGKGSVFTLKFPVKS